MKKYLSFLCVAVLLVLCAGCKKDNDKMDDKNLVGEWHLSTWNGEAQTEFDIYLEFFSDGRCDVFQKLQTSSYVKLSSISNVNGNTLSGIYDDGTKWSCDYEYSLSGDANTLTMTAKTTSADVCVYTRATIPAEVRNSATLPTKSTLNPPTPWL